MICLHVKECMIDVVVSVLTHFAYYCVRVLQLRIMPGVCSHA